MDSGSPVSSWVFERFGQDAEKVRAGVVQALVETQALARDAQVAADTDTNHVYGMARYTGQFKQLACAVGALDTARLVRPNGHAFSLVVVHKSLLLPFRYAGNLATPIESAHMRQPVAKLTQELFRWFAPQPTWRQGTLLESAGSGDSTDRLRPALAHLEPDTRLVPVAFACNVQSGLLAAWWGEAALADQDGHLQWQHCEPLPLNQATPPSGRQRGPSDGPLPSGTGTSPRRFDEGDVPPLEFPQRQDESTENQAE